MALNPNLILGYRSPEVKQVDPVAQFSNGLRLKQMLGEQQTRDQEIADANSQRTAFQSSGGDMAQYLKNLASGGNVKAYQGALTQQAALAKTGQETEHLKSQTANQNSLADKNKVEAALKYLETGASILSTAKDQQSYNSALQTMAQTLGPDTVAKLNPTYDPAQVQSYIAAGTSRAEQLKAEQAKATLAETVRGHDLTAETTMRGQDMTSATAAAGRAQSERHFGVTQANTNKQNGKPPIGYAWGPTGEDGNPTLVAVKGGPADLKIAGALNADTQALTGSMSSFDRLASQANEVLNHPGLAGITGLRGAIPNIPGTEAADAQAKLATLKSQVGFGVLQDMRNNSKTGGALGAVSDAEGKRLEANLAALEKAQSLPQFKSELDKIIKYSEAAKGRLRDAYNLKHGPGSVNPAPEKPSATPAPGTVVDGYKFKGGDPANPASWEKK